VKPDFQTIVRVTDGKRMVETQVDTIKMKDQRGLCFVWLWSKLPGSDEEFDSASSKVAFAQDHLRHIQDDVYVHEGLPIFWEDLSDIGL
jgi:hypothetical protein